MNLWCHAQQTIKSVFISYFLKKLKPTAHFWWPSTVSIRNTRLVCMSTFPSMIFPGLLSLWPMGVFHYKNKSYSGDTCSHHALVVWNTMVLSWVTKTLDPFITPFCSYWGRSTHSWRTSVRAGNNAISTCRVPSAYTEDWLQNQRWRMKMGDEVPILIKQGICI